MKKEIGVTLVALTILLIPNRVFAELKLDRKSYDYGFLIGSLSESCILYKYGNINAKVLKFSSSKLFPCKNFTP